MFGMNHKDVREILVHYRIKCDMAIGERDDGACSQEEYKKAIGWELDKAEKAIIAWSLSKAPDKQTLTKGELRERVLAICDGVDIPPATVANENVGLYVKLEPLLELIEAELTRQKETLLDEIEKARPKYKKTDNQNTYTLKALRAWGKVDKLIESHRSKK